MKPLSGRRAIWLARVSVVTHALEPAGFGVGLAAGIYLTTRQTGAIVLLHGRGAGGGQLAWHGALWLAGVTLVVASLLFFHRKGRRLVHRLTAAATALVFFAIGYARDLGSVRAGSFFGMTTLRPGASFVEDYPARPKIRYEVNRWGLRGRDFAEMKTAGSVRVAVVGDSFVFGSGVEADATLPANLDARLRERFPSLAPFEVLNLGVPGNNLASHFAMLRIAEERLGADVLVLALTLPNDLSAWDGQEERREQARLGAFSLASTLFGYSAAVTFWGERRLVRDLTDEGLAFFEREVTSYAAARRPGSKPLVVFAYSFEDPRVTALLMRLPNAVLVRAVPHVDAHFLPGDGHPTALGNDVFSRAIADAFEPAWLAPAASAQP
jgi:hypothetical protein